MPISLAAERKWDLLPVLIPERYLGGWVVAMGRRERTGNIQFDCTYAFMGNICMTIFKNLNNVLKLACQFVLSEIPSRDTFARVHKGAHCGIVYNNKIHINLKIHHEGIGFINYISIIKQCKIRNKVEIHLFRENNYLKCSSYKMIWMA